MFVACIMLVYYIIQRHREYGCQTYSCIFIVCCSCCITCFLAFNCQAASGLMVPLNIDITFYEFKFSKSANIFGKLAGILNWKPNVGYNESFGKSGLAIDNTHHNDGSP